MENYIAQAVRTEAPITPEVVSRMTGVARLIHAVFGMVTEVGEFTDQLKRHIFYGQSLDLVNLEEEIGDFFWYVAIACDFMKIKNWGHILVRNINKLRKRFPDAFTEYDALNRNLDAERAELEQVASAGLTVVSANRPLDEHDHPSHFEPAALDLTRKIELRGQGIDPTGKYVVIRIDNAGDSYRGHAARQAVRNYAKKIWPNEKYRAESHKLKTTICDLDELEPPLQRTKDEE